MSPKLRLRQSGDFEIFRCIGAACEDTCCGDWGVSIDRKTYEKYQACGDPELQPALHRFITINTQNASNQDFARIALDHNKCPFLAEGLCSIQLKLGESYLSNTCASYPRSIIVIDGTVERSLHLSCPEAARLVLLNQGPYEQKEQTAEPAPQYEASQDGMVTVQGAPILGSENANRMKNPLPHFQEVRDLFLQVLKTVAYPRFQRLVIMAQLSEEFNAILSRDRSLAEQAADTAEFIQRSLDALRAETFQVRSAIETQPLIQIETVLELIVARIASDFTTQRFLECYREFMQGIHWGPESTMEEIARNFAEARLRDYAPFMSNHEYVLDNFLINYVVRTVFPYGHREIANKMGIDYVENAVRRQYLLLAVHYAAVRLVLVGMASFHGAAFGTEHVIKLVQSYAKAFLHSTTYPTKALEILSSNGILQAPDAAVLFQD